MQIKKGDLLKYTSEFGTPYKPELSFGTALLQVTSIKNSSMIRAKVLEANGFYEDQVGGPTGVWYLSTGHYEVV